MPPNPDYPEQAGPSLIYDSTKFDPDNRVLFNITRRVAPERCYFCHTVREVGPGSPEHWQTDQDVHLAAGLTCVDCHRHGLDHAITRGYDGEVSPTSQPARATLTCRGCHLGDAGSDDVTANLGGRHGAPNPLHPGLPTIHFSKLTCTACHAGPWPGDDARQYQTSMAHGLGLSTRDRNDQTPPEIIAPIFGRQPDGSIAPQRMIWPSFWGWLSDGEIRPIPLRTVQKAFRSLPSPPKKDEAAPDVGLSADRIGQALAALQQKRTEQDESVFVHDGRVHRQTSDGELEAFEHPAADPYRWSLAHDVRPATQSLGIRECTDCHASDAPIYFGRISQAGDPAADERPIRVMHELRGDDPVLAWTWGLSFRFRPVFKLFGFLCAGFLACVLAVYASVGLRALLRRARY